VGRFLDNAEKLLQTAESVRDGGSVETDWTILYVPEEGIRMLANCDWPLESLQAHYGAQMVYRIQQQESMVRVEGRAGSRACLLESEKPNWAARRLLSNRRDYLLIPANSALTTKALLPA
jgi:hypothetical protein